MAAHSVAMETKSAACVLPTSLHFERKLSPCVILTSLSRSWSVTTALHFMHLMAAMVRPYLVRSQNNAFSPLPIPFCRAPSNDRDDALVSVSPQRMNVSVQGPKLDDIEVQN